MRKPNVTGRAVGDLEERGRYTGERWGRRQRDRYLAGIEAKFYALRDMPGLGRERRDIDPDLRSCPVQSHVIYYREAVDELRIVRILHQGMLPVRHLEGIGDTSDA